MREHQPDLAFLDIRMPGMTGIEAARAIGDARHIVFVTAYDQYAVDAFEHGAVDYLLKPVSASACEVTVSACKKRLAPAPSDRRRTAGQACGLQLLPRIAGAAKARQPLQWIQASVGQHCA